MFFFQNLYVNVNKINKQGGYINLLTFRPLTYFASLISTLKELRCSMCVQRNTISAITFVTFPLFILPYCELVTYNLPGPITTETQRNANTMDAIAARHTEVGVVRKQVVRSLPDQVVM